MTVKRDAFLEHKKKWNRSPLPWKVTDREAAFPQNIIMAKRDPSLPPFVIDCLADRVRRECSQQRERIETQFATIGDLPFDEDLARPYRDAEERAKKLEAMGEPALGWKLQEIRQHVRVMYAKAAEAKAAAAKAGRDGKSAFNALPVGRRHWQDALREQSREFHSQPSGLLLFSKSDAAAVKASYAYIYDHQPKQDPAKHRERPRWSWFPWNVVMRALCQIKAEVWGGSKTLSDEFYRASEVSSAYVRQRKHEM